MAIRVRSFGSGSSGNAVLVQAAGSAVLIDCGIGSRTLRQGLSASGLEPSELAVVLVTHEHVDHVRSVEWIAKRGVPIASTIGTARAAGIPRASQISLRVSQTMDFDSIRVLPLAVSHDAAEPCGYYIETTEARITVVTDLGCANDALLEPIAHSDLVILEANHDETMLRRGPYPAHLKRRVLSHQGHLSNTDCGSLLDQALNRRSKPITIWLAHLSQVNNTPVVAVNSVQRMLADHFERISLRAMPRYGFDLTWRSDDEFAPSANELQLQLPGV